MYFLIPCSEKGHLEGAFIFSPFSRSQIKVTFAYFYCLTYLTEYFLSSELCNHHIRSIFSSVSCVLLFDVLFCFLITREVLPSPPHEKLALPFPDQLMSIQLQDFPGKGSPGLSLALAVHTHCLSSHHFAILLSLSSYHFAIGTSLR